MQSKSSSVNDSRGNLGERMDDSVLEQICDTIFTLIPEVPRLKQLFQSWCQLGVEERIQLDIKVGSWYSFNRKRLYKPLREALVRWESVQDTQGAPGCEPGIVSFSCDPQLEEELVNVICSLELIFTRRNKTHEVNDEKKEVLREEKEVGNKVDAVALEEEEEEEEEEIEEEEEEEEDGEDEEEDSSLLVNCQEYDDTMLSPRARTVHSVHSYSYINDRRISDDELTGYITN